jgi:hypothetical protein
MTTRYPIVFEVKASGAASAYVPDLLSYLQGEVDARPIPGRFILTGSANLARGPGKYSLASSGIIGSFSYRHRSPTRPDQAADALDHLSILALAADREPSSRRARISG